jgi:hypothetical protein
MERIRWEGQNVFEVVAPQEKEEEQNVVPPYVQDITPAIHL